MGWGSVTEHPIRNAAAGDALPSGQPPFRRHHNPKCIKVPTGQRLVLSYLGCAYEFETATVLVLRNEGGIIYFRKRKDLPACSSGPLISFMSFSVSCGTGGSKSPLLAAKFTPSW